MPEQGSPQKYEPPPMLQNAKLLADIDKTAADAQHSRAQASRVEQEPTLQHLDRIQSAHDAHMDRAVQVHTAREAAKRQPAPAQ